MEIIVQPLVESVINKVLTLLANKVAKVLGVKGELEELQKTLINVKANLEDTKEKEIVNESDQLKLEKLLGVMYDAEDLIDDCRTEAGKLRVPLRLHHQQVRVPIPGCLSCFGAIPTRNRISERIKQINGDLESISKREPTASFRMENDHSDVGGGSTRDTTSLLLESDAVGFDVNAKNLTEELTGGSNYRSEIVVYAIVGMPGVGKTTLARKVYNEGGVKAHFQMAIWLSVTKKYDVNVLLKEIINQKSGETEKCGEYVKMEKLCLMVNELVENKRILVVLDDVWDAKVWTEVLRTPLGKAAKGSRVLITTREKHIATRMDAVYSCGVSPLSDEDGWSMLCKEVFGDSDGEDIQGFKDIGLNIVKKCRGVPLSIKAIGGLLKDKRSLREWVDICERKTWMSNWLPKDIMPALVLSYEGLPYYLKLCFTYCSLLPEGFKFHQKNLVQQWIAEGFVQAEEDREMEKGCEYYKELIKKNLLEESPDYYDGTGCTMHDLIHELALFVSSRGLAAASTKHRHLFIVQEQLKEVKPIEREQDGLRTLQLSRNPSIKEIPGQYFTKLTRLRILDLSYTGIQSLPDSMGYLMQLRLLNLSFTRLSVLPESIKRLSNLQTLQLNGCKDLTMLPSGVVQLTNLRHLSVGAGRVQLDSMPTEMGKLQKLGALHGFVANENRCNLEELNTLSLLTDLTMHKLERVGGKTESEKVALKHKTKLTYLRLSCTPISKDDAWLLEKEKIDKIMKVFEGLRPPPGLESIHIEGFFGQEFPCWMNGNSLADVEWLRLEDCKLCQHLPPLGQLPKLKVLDVRGVSGVSTIGSEFYGDAKHHNSVLRKFPKVEELYFIAMTELQQWFGPEGAWPCLKKLHIMKCSKLTSLPGYLHQVAGLRELVIEEADNLQAIENLPSVTKLRIKKNPRLKVVSNLQALKSITISHCSALEDVASVDMLSHVVLSDKKMKALPKWLLDMPGLSRLDMKGHSKLVVRCDKNGKYWPQIRCIPNVDIRSQDSKLYVSYRMTPYSFRSQLGEIAQDGSSSSTF